MASWCASAPYSGTFPINGRIAASKLSNNRGWSFSCAASNCFIAGRWVGMRKHAGQLSCVTGKPARMLRSKFIEAWDGPDSPGTLPMPLQYLATAEAHQRIGRAMQAGSPGAAELAVTPVGQIVGRMNQLRPAPQVVAEMVSEYLDTVGSRFGELRKEGDFGIAVGWHREDRNHANFYGRKVAVNELRLVRELKDRPFDQVWDDLDASYHQLLGRLEGWKEKDLFDAKRFKWMKGEPFVAYIAGDSYEHYAEHAAQIRAWRQTLNNEQ